MFRNLTGWHALVILAVVVLVFGAARLPALAKSVGESMRILKRETQQDDAERPVSAPAPATVVPDGTTVPAPSSAAFDATHPGGAPASRSPSDLHAA